MSERTDLHVRANACVTRTLGMTDAELEHDAQRILDLLPDDMLDNFGGPQEMEVRDVEFTQDGLRFREVMIRAVVRLDSEDGNA